MVTAQIPAVDRKVEVDRTDTVDSTVLLHQAVTGQAKRRPVIAEAKHNRVTLDPDRDVTLGEIWAISEGRAAVEPGPGLSAHLARSRELLERLIAENRRVYGVTTGFGPLACQHVTPAVAEQHQQNLIYHLTSGVGAPFTIAETRAILAARLVSLSKGHSGIRPATFSLLVECLNRNVIPVVPSQGTVGASGDLTPLAHIALGLMGEGEIWLDGVPAPAAEALSRMELTPVTLAAKEGLALVNGTSAMTGLAARNGYLARQILAVSTRFSLLFAEVLGGKIEAYAPEISRVRPHPGQQRIAAELFALAQGSTRLEPLTEPPRIDAAEAQDGVIADQPLLQDPYTIRCAPQILGAVADTIDHHDRVVGCELNSVTDNPLLFPSVDDPAYGFVRHGGNFFGLPVGLASDSLHTALIYLGVLGERQIARLCDPLLSGGLPPYLQGDRTGLQSGLMGAQVTASALVAEMRAGAMPVSIQSIPTNNNNQDVNPMGTVAARHTSRAIHSLFRLLAIEGIALAQAHDLRVAQRPDQRFSQASTALVREIRRHVEYLGQDRPLYRDIERLARALHTIDLPDTDSPGGTR